MILTAAAAFLLSASPMAQDATRAGALTTAEPAKVATLDDLKGEPSRLAWSPDGSEFYVQTLEGGFGNPKAKLRHYIISATDGKKRDAGTEPEWALDYWKSKSDRVSPDDPAFRIELKSESRREQTTAVPRGGDLARGGTTVESSIGRNDAVDAAFNSQIAFLNTMLLKGQAIGVFDNTVIVPGLTFGWGPKGSGIIAFSHPGTGRIVTMDATGTTKEVAGSKEAVLPAWSPDGSRLAWLQKDGKKKVVLQVARVSRS
ncbi:MAG: hypothetical protein M3R55_04415 [Acidobacteriota bacterium]|nr:hypothetical protein [Acidobacteriota bacterium]